MASQRKTQLILSCHGNLRRKSIAKIFEVSEAYISNLFSRHGLYEEERNPQRSYEAWRESFKL